MDDGNQAVRDANRRIIMLHEAAAILHASYSTVLSMATSGELPAFHIHNSWRTSDVAIDAYVARSM